MMLLGFLLLQVVLGDLAPLYLQEKTVNKAADLRSYIVVFTDDAPELDARESIQKWLSEEVRNVDVDEVNNVYNVDNKFRGFQSYFTPAGLFSVRSHKYVKYVEEDGVVQLDAFTDRQDWGQIRVNQQARNLATNNAQYNYTSGYPNQNLDITVWNFVAGIQALVNGDGSRATVCVVDTGIRASHQELAGRVDATTSFVAGQTTDGNGHGTHCAGSCCGRYRGMARNVRITSAKVLSDAGSGTNANVISGVNWCANRATNAQMTYIISMSLGGAQATAVNDAVNAAAPRSIPVVAAGNENADACTRSPASAREAITVAASDKDDTKASFSNVGTCVDIWAPGVSIHSSWYTSDTAYNTISGTSMATPLVAGLVATMAPASGYLTRSQGLTALTSRASNGTIRNCPTNTANRLASTGRTP
jgi:subtilisin family serine protease